MVGREKHRRSWREGGENTGGKGKHWREGETLEGRGTLEGGGNTGWKGNTGGRGKHWRGWWEGGREGGILEGW